MKDAPKTLAIEAILKHPMSTKEQAYQLGYDAGRLAGIVEANQQLDKIFAERFVRPSETPL